MFGSNVFLFMNKKL